MESKAMDGPDILATTRPRNLFGEAVDDPRSLKRAYATLIRAFAPDDHPEVFAHIRSLYESARDGVALDPSEPVAAPSAVEHLEQALKDGHVDLAIELLDQLMTRVAKLEGHP